MKATLAVLALAVISTLVAARPQKPEQEQQPWTQLPLKGLEREEHGRSLKANTGPFALQASGNGLGAVGKKSDCNVYSASGSSPSCTGNYPFPACCDDTQCSTNANGKGGQCSSSGPYPACCPAFSRASDRCDDPDNSGTCSSPTYPVPACCDDDSCYVFADASGTKCTGGRVAGCCPA